ncbi:MAG: serine hydrolase domain-containing protein [Actinomycetota bacterium]
MPSPITRENWLDTPHNRWSFHHVGEVLDTVPIVSDGRRTITLPRRHVDLDGVPFRSRDGSMTTWARHLDESFCDATCVIHDGSIVYERYFNGLGSDSRHLLMSVTKSFTAAALGIAIGRGLLSTSTLVTDIAPEFAGTSLDGCTVRHVIDMTAGTDFVEDYDLYENPDGDVPLIEYERQAGFRPLGDREPVGVLRHFATYPLARPHGIVFDYRSPLTNIAARIVEIVNDLPFDDVLSRDVWSAFGMEHAAEMSVDHHGFPIAEAGLCCSVRDLAKFGLAYLNDGVLDAQRVLPASWVDDTFRGDDDARTCYLRYLDSPAHSGVEGADWSMYHNAFWIRHAGAQMSGLGIFGQYVWIDRPSRTVIARFSSYPTAAPAEISAESIRGFNAVATALTA